MCTGIKIESLFLLLSIKKDKQTTSLMVKIDKAKIENLLMKKKLVLNQTLYTYIIYNSTYKVKQCFKCYEYSYIFVHC